MGSPEQGRQTGTDGKNNLNKPFPIFNKRQYLENGRRHIKIPLMTNKKSHALSTDQIWKPTNEDYI